MKVLLVNPPPFAIVEPAYDRPAYPRTSLACLAAYLRAAGVDVAVLDCKYDRVGFDEGLAAVARMRPDVVGLCGLTNEIEASAFFAAGVKRIDPAITTVIGDVHVSALPERTLREFPAFDVGVIGEGEATLLEVVRQLERGEPVTAPGSCRLDERGAYRAFGARSAIDVSTLPEPAWDLFRPAEKYMPQTSRGCPFACGFCMNPAGRKVRARTPTQVVDELETLVGLGRLRSLYFGDEIFTVQRERIVELCRLLVDRGLHTRVRWSCQTHVNTIDQDLAERMRAAGCEGVGLGIETAHEDTMKTMGKGIDRARVMKAVTALRAARLPFYAFFILGQPNETAETAKQTVDFAVEMNASHTVFGIMVPYPGTKIRALAERGEGGYLALSDDWNEYNKQLGNAVQFAGISRRKLERIQMLAYLRVFVQNGRTLQLLAMVPRFTVQVFHMLLNQLGLLRRAVRPPPLPPPNVRKRSLPVLPRGG